MAIKKISEFPKVTPSAEDKILIEKNDEGGYINLSEMPVSTPVEKKISDVQKDLNDRITALAFEPGDTTGDAELKDIRKPATGFTVPANANAGDAVRAQVTQLDEKISNLKGDLGELDIDTANAFSDALSGKSNINIYKKNVKINLGAKRTSGEIILDGKTCHTDILQTHYLSDSWQVLFDNTIYKIDVVLFDTEDETGGIETGYITTSPCSLRLSDKEYAVVNVRKIDGSDITNDDIYVISKSVRIMRYVTNLFALRTYVTDAAKDAVKVAKSYTNVRLDGNTVSVGNGKDFNNLRVCFDNISPTREKPYIVLLYGGEYDLKSYYTDEELSSSDFVGLKIPDYVTLIGVEGKENTILKWEHPTNTSKISPINLSNNVSIIGLTVKGNNTRYVVHDDYANIGMENKRFIKDCDFISDSLVYDYVYGSGEKGGADWYFENCSFLAPLGKCAFLQHNNINEKETSYLHFKNCRFRGSTNVVVVLSSLNNGTTSFNHAYFEGCKIFNSTGSNAKITLNENSASAYGSGIKYKVSGYGNKLDSVIINNTDGEDYSSFVDLI